MSVGGVFELQSYFLTILLHCNIKIEEQVRRYF